MEGEDWTQLLDVLCAAFAGMAGRIDPPSSLTRMRATDLPAIAKSAEIWVIGTPVVATVTLTPRACALYIGRLAVVPDHPGQGLSRQRSCWRRQVRGRGVWQS